MNLPILVLTSTVIAIAIAIGVILFLTARKRDMRQMETDLRLTYKRFKELYPYSTITYAEYKRLQAQKAYKRAVSSMKIKRMVR